MLLGFLGVLPLIALLTGATQRLDGVQGGSSDASGSQGEGDAGAQDDDAGSESDDDDDDDSLESSHDANATFEQGYKRMLQQYGGNPDALARQLYRDNYGVREKLRNAKADAERAKKQLPRKGAAVLNANEFNTYKAYRGIGLSPQQIQQEIEAGRAARAQLAARVKDDTLREVAETVGFNFQAMKDTAAGNQTYVVKTVERDGAQVKEAFIVTGTEQDRREVPVMEFANANWQHLLPALQGTTQGQGGTVSRQNGGFVRQPAPNTRRVEQQQSAAQSVLSGYKDPVIPGTQRRG